MIHMVTNKINDTINLGSGEGYPISELANIISKYSDKEVKYDVSKSGGDKKRVMDMTKAFSYGFELKYSIEQALLETIEDYRDVQSN
jgi:nucleoside-diphosphate-sugar epimerase